MSADTTTRRSPLVLVGIGLGVVALLAALWFLVVAPLLAGDDVADDPQVTPGQAAEQPGPSATASPTETASEPDEIPIATYEIFLSRDPFEPVIAPAPSGGSSGDGGTDGGGTDGGGTDGGGTDGGGTDGGGTDGGGTDGSGTVAVCEPNPALNETVCEEEDVYVVELVEVGEDGSGPFIVVNLTPSGGSTTTYSGLRAGDRFGPLDPAGEGKFGVLSIEVAADCARMFFVDEQFQICQGDRVLK